MSEGAMGVARMEDRAACAWERSEDGKEYSGNAVEHSCNPRRSGTTCNTFRLNRMYA